MAVQYVQTVCEDQSQPSPFLPTGHRCLFQSQRAMRSVFRCSFLPPPNLQHCCVYIILYITYSFFFVVLLLLSFLLLFCFFFPIQAFLTQLVCHLLDEGNSCYRDGDWQQATQQYSEGISVARYAQAEALVIPHELLECLYVNRAAAFYQAVSHSAMSRNVILTAIQSI